MNAYELKNTDEIISPSLVYYLDVIKKNTEEMLRVAGDTKRLWPHIKTHKCVKMVELLMEYGITKFKAATIAEAEMAAIAGAEKVILAYPLIGPNMKRFINLAEAYPKTEFYAVEDNYEQLKIFSDLCEAMKFSAPCLIDVNTGLNRTGAPFDELEELYRKAAELKGVKISGFHCYDGDNHEVDFNARMQKVKELDDKLAKVINALKLAGYECGIIVVGGTPTFPCHARYTDYFLSPGTSFVHDFGYGETIPDLACNAGAAVLTRVISRPAKGYFTLDLGYKGIASDPPGQRGQIAGYEDAVQVMQNEEHWVFSLEDEARVPEIGTVLYVIPTHICPTSALYPEVLIAQDGMIVDHWQVTARNRKINF